eukprot:1135420-Prorocentrum_minimum.AAC.4
MARMRYRELKPPNPPRPPMHPPVPAPPMRMVGDGQESVHEGHYHWPLAYGENTIEVRVR